MARPKILQGRTIKIKTGCGNLYVTCNFHDGKIQEVFCRLGKAGGCSSCQTEALGRLISLALKNDVPVEKIIKNLKGISCHRPIQWGHYKNLSCADATAKAIEITLKDGAEEKLSAKKNKAKNHIEDHKTMLEESQKEHDLQYGSKTCPDCGGPNFIYESGCTICKDCGYSDCH